MQLTHAKALRRAFRLEFSRGGQRRPSRDSSEVEDALGAVSRNDKMDLAPFASKPREQRPDHALVVGMGEDSEQRAIGSNRGSLLKARRARNKRKCGDRHDSRLD